MFDSDLPEKSASAYVLGQPIATFSLDELDATVAALKAEILRIEEASRSKRASLAAAQDIFKSAR